MERLRTRLSPAMIVACTALFVSLSGFGYAAIKLPANSVGTKQLKKNAVNSAKVKRHSLLRSDFKPGQVPRGAQGIQGIQGVPGTPGAPGAPGTPATRLWAYVSGTGALRGGSGVVATSRTSLGTFSVTFNQSIVNWACDCELPAREQRHFVQRVKSLLGHANQHDRVSDLHLELGDQRLVRPSVRLDRGLPVTSADQSELRGAALHGDEDTSGGSEGGGEPETAMPATSPTSVTHTSPSRWAACASPQLNSTPSTSTDR
jgi:hypothetical protein